VIRGAMEGFDPDVLIVDHLPLGAARELADTLYRLRSATESTASSACATCSRTATPSTACGPIRRT